jgi:hypothetical protein
VGGGGASVVPLSSGRAEGSYSSPEIGQVAPLPESANTTTGMVTNGHQERVAKSKSHGSDGQQEAKAAEEAVNDDFQHIGLRSPAGCRHAQTPTRVCVQG